MTSATRPTTKKNQARDVINALCQILNGSGYTSRITPERFRQAKFDQPEAVGPLWTLLAETVAEKFPALRDLHCASGPDRDTIKSILHRLGYRCKHFQDASDTSSREILLALGWFLARCNTVNQEVERQLDNSSLRVVPCHPSISELESIAKNNEKEKQLNRGPPQTPPSPAAQVRYLVWMMGRLRLTLKALYCEQQAVCSAMHHVHHTTQGVSAPPHQLSHLTAWDAYLLRHPKQLKKYMEQLEKEASILQACIYWRELEPVFWQWMSSVQEAKLAEMGQDTIEAHTDTPYNDHPRLSLSREGFLGVSELTDLEASLSKQLHHLEAVLSSAGVHQVLQEVPDSPDVAKRKTDIDNSVKAKLAVDSEQLRKPGPKEYPLHTVSFHYNPKESINHRQKNESIPDCAVNIKSEILRLTGQVRMLEDELDELRIEQQQKLDHFVESLTNVVCIPPMSEKAAY